MNLMDIHFLVQEFYAIEAITAMLAVKKNNRFAPMRHSHSRWYRDFTDFRDEYIKQFASVIYDYTALVVAAEMRHCKDRASQYIGDYYTSSSRSREEVYDECFEFNANDILTAGIRMFDTKLVKWNNGYGGYKWYQIAKAGLMKGKVSDCVFIDHCVDLSHNNSVYFDKGANVFYLHSKLEYQHLLDLKFSCKPQDLINEKQGYAFNRLLMRANNLGIIRKKAKKPKKTNKAFSQPYRDLAETLLFNYHPIEWGQRRLNYSGSNIILCPDFDNGTKPTKVRRDNLLRCA